MNHAHASRLTNGGMAAVGRAYPLEPLADLPVRRVYRARVLACTLVMIEAYDNQHTSLLVEPLEPLE
ncbi:hypothetical protein VSR01_02145 [Actinacidiphila sp. DG2A-62]|uniref:hypothetical protein n=1 Tax=Actinacidiphila sp. DG2A-62 TaxID=3108821 RepID=UPI002DB9F781|nr:hypothetical protein [Actinacidiphila sp. DG2A-62]MEC3992408.1 hypothetical protein [Actinacidiphila sp. DG2A-62]